MFTYSIIVPVYNAEKYLPKCIESIVEQSYRNYEVILIDDGSTDRSGQLCDDFKSGFDNVTVYHQRNKGQSAARNIGISAAKGEFLLFIDADDLIERDTLQILDDYLSLHNCDILCMNNVIMINEKGHIIKSKRHRIHNPMSTLKFVRKHFIETVWAYVIRKELVVKNEIHFVETIKYYEDSNFILKCLSHVKNVDIINQQLYNYRWHNESIVHKAFTYQWAYSNLEAAKDALNYIKKKGQRKDYKFLDYIITFYLKNFFVMLFRLGEKNYELKNAYYDLRAFLHFIKANFTENSTFKHQIMAKHFKFTQFLYCVSYFFTRLKIKVEL